ncbi:MAG: MBL fold metallo-hydrolase [Myxococcales bacterium]|nr:MBL fold metallo-hydrolase [Myxococcales bacterium]
MEIQFVGAAQTVTGSMHLVRTEHATVLLDCGLYQGRRRESYERNRNLPVPVREIDAVVLSHAHIDHSGALPMLVKAGYDGPIYTTHATNDLCAAMLRDAAYIQEADARHINKSISRGEIESELIEPLYTEEDVIATLERVVGVPYHRRVTIAKGVDLTFYDAGHVLGSAISALDVDEVGQTRRVVFTGDLGRHNMPILRDPEIVSGAEALITESTYGDRLHDPIAKMDEDLATIVERTVKRGGKVIIPAFALERAQEIVFALKGLRAHGKLPRVPVYIDSPLTVKITEVFKLHPECFDAEARRLLQQHDSPFEFEGLRYVEDVEESKAISVSESPAVIIAASGMCEAGRVLHHLRAGVEDDKNTVIIVGFQAQHTLGRRLVERRDRVRIFGVERDRRCQVEVLNGFSAHADQNDLINYAEALREHGKLRTIALVHGETKAQTVLRDKLDAKGHLRVVIPRPDDRMKV